MLKYCPVLLAQVSILQILLFHYCEINLINLSLTNISFIQFNLIACPTGNVNGVAFALVGSGLATDTIAPSLNIKIGDNVTFTLSDSSANPNHPLEFCNNPLFCTGATGSQLIKGPITVMGSAIWWSPTTAGTYYYGCNNHMGMGGTINVVAVDTICSYYTRALNSGSANSIQQAATIQAVVVRAFTGDSTTTPVVPGLIALDSAGGLKSFFDGTRTIITRPGVAAQAINFITPGTAQTTLVTHLVSFFGTALGCNAPGFPQPKTLLFSPSMAQLHSAMGINNAQLTYFTNQIVLSITSYAGSLTRQSDADAITNFDKGFGRGATDAAVAGLGLSATPGASQQVCIAADCPLGAGSGASLVSAPGLAIGIALIATIASLLV